MDLETLYRDRITGHNLIAGTERGDGPTFRAVSPESGEELPGEFHEATEAEVLAAVSEADKAFRAAWLPSAATIATMLRAAADELEVDADAIVALVQAETALGATRGRNELARTTNQLRFFAAEAEKGSFVEATVTLPDATAPGGARVDARRMLVPLGPVAVFGASNFPLAYSVAGGDTAAALATGCPVIFKAHPAHPALSEVVARALSRGVAAAGLPAAWFSLVHGRGNDVGTWLVTAPELTAVGFTGSLGGGRALYNLAASRPHPIPVYAEMGALNPVFVTSRALEARAEAVAASFVGAITTDAGQFCVKPGLVFLPPADGRETFVKSVVEGVRASDPGLLVSDRIHAQLSGQVSLLETVPGLEVLARSEEYRPGQFSFPATVLRCNLETWRNTPELSLEYFGPVSVLVDCDDEDELLAVANDFEGTLTSTVHAEAEDPSAAALLGAVTQRSGRVVWNGMPTGLAVSHATNHTGPYPASTNVGHTSVGSTSARRFQRPVAYQTTPDALLPDALKDANPLGILRNIDGRITTDPVARTA
jgi:NADP-dependent aldehyde dehydrogenase